jgi:hypothetical protein
MEDKSAAEQIDAIIKMPGDWRGETLSRLRALIKQADSDAVEEVKWKKPSRPEESQCGPMMECYASPIRSRGP